MAIHQPPHPISPGDAFRADFLAGLRSDVGLRFCLRARFLAFDPKVYNVGSGFGNVYLRAYDIESKLFLPGSLLCGLTNAGRIYNDVPTLVIILNLTFAELRGCHFTEYVRVRALDFRN